MPNAIIDTSTTPSTVLPGRRRALKVLGAAVCSAAGAPAFAQNKPIRIGVMAPRGGVTGTVGECGLRGMQWATTKLNAGNGIGGRKIELIIEEETSPKDSIERFRSGRMGSLASAVKE